MLKKPLPRAHSNQIFYDSMRRYCDHGPLEKRVALAIGCATSDIRVDVDGGERGPEVTIRVPPEYLQKAEDALSDLHEAVRSVHPMELMERFYDERMPKMSFGQIRGGFGGYGMMHSGMSPLPMSAPISVSVDLWD